MDDTMGAPKAIVDWSRWLIGVGVVAIGGCMAMLEPEMAPAQRDHIALAITAFLASVLVASLLGLIVALFGRSRAVLWIAGFLGLVQLVGLGFGAWEVHKWVSNFAVSEGSEDDRVESAVARAQESASKAERAAADARETLEEVERLSAHVDAAVDTAVTRAAAGLRGELIEQVREEFNKPRNQPRAEDGTLLHRVGEGVREE